MSSKSRYVIPFFMIVGMINAECEECFPGKSLQELQDMYEQEVQQLPEYQKLVIIRNNYNDQRKKIGKESTKCNIYREYPRFNSCFIGACEDNCKAVDLYEKELFEIEDLRKYAQDKLDEAMPPYARSLRQCILKRKHVAIKKEQK